MQDVQDKISDPPLGLRDRKRAQTHARIQAEAMRLFTTQGFEATTLDAVAEAAGVSRRTLFHYFGSKEEIVFSTKAGLGDLIIAAIKARPVEEPLLAMTENALIDMSANFQGAGPRALARLIRDTPALRAGDQAKHEALERLLADALIAHKGLAHGDLAARTTAVTAIGILKMATEAWLTADDEHGPEVHGRRAFEALRAIARAT